MKVSNLLALESKPELIQIFKKGGCISITNCHKNYIKEHLKKGDDFILRYPEYDIKFLFNGVDVDILYLGESSKGFLEDVTEFIEHRISYERVTRYRAY